MTTEVNEIKTGNYNRGTVPPVDIYETGNEYVIKADIPGVTRENLDITLDDDILAINGRVNEDPAGGSLKYGGYSLYNFSRSFNVGKDVDETAVTASTEHGVLTLTLPKKEKVKPKKVSITTH
jgi:HSP20 family protein